MGQKLLLEATFGACTWFAPDPTTMGQTVPDPIIVNNTALYGPKDDLLLHYKDILAANSVGLYHEFASMLNATRTGDISSTVKIVDASISAGFTGSPASYFAAKAYKMTKDFLDS